MNKDIVTAATEKLKEVERAFGDSERDYCGVRARAERLTELLIEALFPRFGSEAISRKLSLGQAAVLLEDCLESVLPQPEQGHGIVLRMLEALPEVLRALKTDLKAAYQGDPAAQSVDEVILCYPAFIAISTYRLAHVLYLEKVPLLPRLMTEYAHRLTGIDIHPGATIGDSFFIDHGTGVVIGETAIIGQGVRLYQHVTLGARSPLGLAPTGPRTRHARHPIVEDDVTIYAGATILGRVTIGRGSVIGGNVWLLDDVPPESVVAQPEAIRLAPAARAALSERLAEHGA